MVNRRIIVGSFGLFGWAGLVYADSTVDFFTDPALFDAAIQQAGKVSKGKWDFQATHSQPANTFFALNDPLNVDNSGPFDVVPLNNITIQSNKNEGGSQGKGGPNPRGDDGLAFVNKVPGLIDNTAVAANFAGDSFDILSGPPAGDNHTAMAMDVVNLLGMGSGVIVTVYDKKDILVDKLELHGPLPMKQFVGLIMGGGKTIGRVNIDAIEEGFEGISQLEVYVPAPGALALLGIAGLIGTPRRRRWARGNKLVMRSGPSDGWPCLVVAAAREG